MKVRLGKPGRKNAANTVIIDRWDAWNLDDTFAKIIHPALCIYRLELNGHPQLWEDGMVTPHYYSQPDQLHFDFIDETVEEKYLEEKWMKIVDKMIRAFGLITHKWDWEESWTNLSYEEKRKQENAYYKEIDEGLALFAKHYHSLWD